MQRSIKDLPLAEYIRDLRDQHQKGEISRQDFLRWGAVFGASVPLLTAWAADAQPTAAADKQAAAMAPQMGGTLRCVSSFPPVTVEPPLLTEVAGAATVHQVNERLVTVDSKGVVHPFLAESWSSSADAKTWTFKLRQGITFNNGATFSADDVVWTFDLLLNPKTASSAASTLTYLTANNVEKVDNYTVRFHLNRAVATFPYDINNYMIVMLPKNWPGTWAKNPVGTGPFLLQEYVVGDHATYTRNPNYWRKGLPYLDGLRITYTKTGLAADNMMVSGQADVSLFTYASDLPTLKHFSKIKILIAHSAAYNPIHMRSDEMPFSDNRVREAFKYMVDREQMVKFVYAGYGDVGNDNMVAPVYPEYSNNGLRKQNIPKAKALLAAAGYPNGFAIDFYGVAAGASGGPDPVTVVFQQMAAQAGVKVTLRPETSNIYYEHWTDVPLGTIGWVGRPTVDAMLNLAFRCNVPWNESHWCEAGFDVWLNQLDATVDLAQRRAIARKIEDYMTTQGPEIIWGFQNILRAIGPNVNGVEASSLSYSDLSAAWLSKA